MRQRVGRSRLVVIAAIVCLITGVWLAPTGAQAPADISVIVHPGVAVDNLSFADLRRVLTGDQEFWPNGGARVTIFIRAPVARERDVVVKDVCQMTEAQFRQHWIAKVFRADATSTPKIVYSNDAAIEQVGRTPGAIAFVQGAVTAKSVKVVRIDGRAPGQSGYRLR